jgi:hypothetical protein
MRSLERRRYEEGPLYQVATYLATLDQLFDEQANLLREQTHRAEQASEPPKPRQGLQPRSAAKQSPKSASGRPETGVCKNGPEVEHQSRQLEKTMFYSGHPSEDGDHSLKIHKPHPRTLKVLLPPLKEMVLHNPWQMEIQRTTSKDYSHSPPQKKARPTSKITDATLVMCPQPLLLKSCP